MPKPRIQPIATFIEHRELYGSPARLEELQSLLRDLDPVDCIRLLCQMNADFRLTKRDKEPVAKMQQEIAGGLLSDEAISRLKRRFGNEHMAERPIFHPVQMLNVLRLVVEHSVGSRSPLSDDGARYVLGDACLMMSDLMMTEQERRAVKSGDSESISGALMAQMLGPFELQNTATIQHVVYRSRIMFRELLRKEAVLNRIRRQCEGFDFEDEFSRITGVSLTRWLILMLAFHAYLMHYRDQDGVTRHPEFLSIDRLAFRKDTPIRQEELDAALRSVSGKLGDFNLALQANGTGDWRFDSVPFRSKPFIELEPGKFHCVDLGLLVEKIHSGVYWTIHDGLSGSQRWGLSRAWGILFEEYVNWFFGERDFKDFLFWPVPKFIDGTEAVDGALMKNGVFMPMEYKGGFLLRGARYSGDRPSLERELESKIAKGCKQLAKKIELLFNRRSELSKTLVNIPLDHVTRVVPLLIVQDQILGGPLVNWRLNKSFNEVLDRTALRYGVAVDALSVVGVRELETMVESAEAGTFDFFGALQCRCYLDPEMRSNLHNFLLGREGYGEERSMRIKTIIDEQFRETTEYLFGKNRAAA